MSILGKISNFCSKISPIKPLKKIAGLVRSGFDKITGGRGLKIWSKPALRHTKSAQNFHEFELENGLKVLVKQAAGTQVRSELVFNSGGTKDPKGKEGIAHFLEHIVPSATIEFKKNLDDVCKLNGGNFNAYTGERETGYWNELPHDKLDLGLRILAGALDQIDIDPAEFEKEKAVISTEILRSGSEAGKKIIEREKEILYGKDHPLQTNVIGSKESVQALSIEDLKQFKAAEYVPNNATLVISGNVDLLEVKKLITRYFGKFEAKPSYQEQDLTQGIKASEQKDHHLKDSSLPSVLKYIYPTAAFKHREELIASLIDAALTGGNNARLQRKLVDGESNNGKAAAIFVDAGIDSNKFFGHFKIVAKPIDENRDANLTRIAQVIDEELADLATNGLKPEEFKKLIDQMEASKVYELDSQHSRIGELAHYKREGEDWQNSLKDLEDLKTISNDEIKAYVSKHLIPNNRYSLTVHGSGQDLALDYQQGLDGKNIDDAKATDAEEKILSPEQLDKLITLSKGISKLDVKLTGLEKTKYPNGMQLFFKQDSSLPLVFADVNFEGGSLSVPEEMSSSLGMLNSLLAETGTYNPNSKRRLDKQEIEKLEESLGMSFHQGTGIDTGHIHLASLSKNTERALALANEQLCYPAILATENPEIVKIVEEEFARQKKQSIDMMRMIHNVLNGIEAAETFAKAIYPKGHKHYQKTLEEAIKDIENIKLDDVRRLYQQLFHAQNAQITVVGDINKQDIDSKLVPMLDSWNEAQHGSQRKADYSRIAEVPAPKASLKLITSKDNKPETTVIIGNPMGIQQDDADYLPAMLANQILGSGFNSRLFAKVREERGLVYSIGSMIMPMRNGSGPFTINLGCDPKNTKHAISETVATVNKFLEEGITEQELDLAKSSAKKGFAMHQFNSRASTCSALSGLQLRDKDENYVNNFDKEIDSITKEQVMAAAQKFIKPKNFTIVATKPKDFRMSEASLTQEQNSQTQAKQYAVAA